MVVLLTGSRCQHDVNQRFVLFDPLDQDMFYRDIRKALQDPPSRCCMDIVKQNDLSDFGNVFVVQSFQSSTQLIRVGVFAIDHDHGVFAGAEIFVNASPSHTRSHPIRGCIL